MLTKEEVLQIAKLARLDLTEAEVDKFKDQLSSVLDLFKKVDEIDLKETPETSQVTGLENVWRNDEVSCQQDLTCCTSEELLVNIPAKEETQIKVPKVLGGGDDA